MDKTMPARVYFLASGDLRSDLLDSQNNPIVLDCFLFIPLYLQMLVFYRVLKLHTCGIRN